MDFDPLEEGNSVPCLELLDDQKMCTVQSVTAHKNESEEVLTEHINDTKCKFKF